MRALLLAFLLPAAAMAADPVNLQTLVSGEWEWKGQGKAGGKFRIDTATPDGNIQGEFVGKTASDRGRFTGSVSVDEFFLIRSGITSESHKQVWKGRPDLSGGNVVVQGTFQDSKTGKSSPFTARRSADAPPPGDPGPGNPPLNRSGLADVTDSLRKAGMNERQARIATMLHEVGTGTRSASQFYAELGAMKGSMTEVIQVRSTLVQAAEPGLARKVLGATYPEGGTLVEQRLLVWRKEQTLAAIDETLKRFSGRVPAEGVKLIVAHVGKWATQDSRALTFPGDIDFSFVCNDQALSKELREAYLEIIRGRAGLDQKALDAVSTQHGKAGLDVYIGRHGMAYAEKNMKVNEVVDLVSGTRRSASFEEVTRILSEERDLLDSRGVETIKPVRQAQPGLSMEMVRHFDHDIAKSGIFDASTSIVKAAKYLDRSYTAEVESIGAPDKPPKLAAFARTITELANAKPQSQASRDAMIREIASALGATPTTVWDAGSKRLRLTVSPAAVKAFHDQARREMWDSAERGSRLRTEEMDRRMGELAERQRRGEPVDADAEVLRQDMVDLIDMVEAETKAIGTSMPVPTSVRTNNAKVRSLLQSLSKGFGVKALSADDLKDKKFVEELLAAQRAHPDPTRLQMVKAYVMDRAARAAEKTMKGVDGTNQILDTIDGALLSELRGDGEFAEFETEVKSLVKGSSVAKTQRLNVMKEKLARGIRTANQVVNTKLQSVAVARQGMKLMAVTGLADEMLAYRDAWSQQGWEGFATELFRRRIPGGSAVENAMMGNTLRAGWDVVTTIFPPAGLPEAAYGMAKAAYSAGYSLYWSEQLSLFIDTTYDGAKFELVEVETTATTKVGVYRLVSVKHPRTGKRVDLSEFVKRRQDEIADLNRRLKTPRRDGGGIDMAAFRSAAAGLTDWEAQDAILARNLEAADPVIALIDEMASNPAVGPRLMERYGQQRALRWQEVKLAFLTELVDRLEARKQAEQALGSGMLPELFQELRQAAASLEIEPQVLRSLDADVDTNNLKQLIGWLWDAKRNALGQAPKESETLRAAQVVKKYLDAYRGVLKTRDDLAASLPAAGARDGNQRYLTGTLFLVGRPDADTKAASAWAQQTAASRKASADAVLAIKREFLPKADLDADDLPVVERVFTHDLWIRPFRDAGSSRPDPALMDRAVFHTARRKAELDDYRNSLRKLAPVQLTVAVVDATDPKKGVNGATGDLRPNEGVGKPAQAAGNPMVFGVPSARYRLTVKAPGYEDDVRDVLLGRALDKAPTLTVRLKPAGGVVKPPVPPPPTTPPVPKPDAPADFKVVIDAPTGAVPFGTSVTLNARAQGGRAPHAFSWSTGATGARAAVQPQWAGEWTVTVGATDADGRTGKGQATLRVAPEKVRMQGVEARVYYGNQATLSLPGQDPPPPDPTPAPPPPVDDCADPSRRRTPFDDCGPVTITKSVSTANQKAVVLPTAIPPSGPPPAASPPAPAPAAAKGSAPKRVVWQSDPVVTFAPPTSADGRTKVIYSRMGPVKLWCEIQKEIEGVFHTVGECEQQTVQVVAPRFSVQFTPPEGQGRLGQEVRLRVNSDPPIPDPIVDFRWQEPGTSNRSELTPNAREIAFTVKDGRPLVLKTIARVPHHGDTIAEVSATYTGLGWTVSAKVVEPGNRPMMWDPAKVGLVPVPKGQYATHERVSLRAEVQGAAPAVVRWNWTVNEGSTISSNVSQTPTVSRSGPGSIEARVEARDGEGVLLGTADVAVNVIEVSDKPPAPVDPVVRLTASGARVDAGQPVTFSAEASSGKPPYRYAWQGADGQGAQARIASARAGRQTVTVVVTDGQGRTATASTVVEVAVNAAEVQQGYGKTVQAKLDEVRQASAQKEFRRALEIAQAWRQSTRLDAYADKELSQQEEWARKWAAQKDQQIGLMRVAADKVAQHDYAGALKTYEEAFANSQITFNGSEPEYREAAKLRNDAFERQRRLEAIVGHVRDAAENREPYYAQLHVLTPALGNCDEAIGLQPENAQFKRWRELIVARMNQAQQAQAPAGSGPVTPQVGAYRVNGSQTFRLSSLSGTSMKVDQWQGGEPEPPKSRGAYYGSGTVKRAEGNTWRGVLPDVAGYCCGNNMEVELKFKSPTVFQIVRFRLWPLGGARPPDGSGWRGGGDAEWKMVGAPEATGAAPAPAPAPVPVPVPVPVPAAAAAGPVFDNCNTGGVYNKPSRPTAFTLGSSHRITMIRTYHWNDGRGATSPGTIALQGPGGRTYGPWQARGTAGQGGVPNANWIVSPDVDLPAGTYTVVDSNPASWSQNGGSQGSGHTRVEGLPLAGSPAPPPQAPPAKASAPARVMAEITNRSSKPVHVFPSGQTFGPGNRFSAGEMRRVQVEIPASGSITFNAGRDGIVRVRKAWNGDPDSPSRVPVVIYDEPEQLIITTGLR